MNKESPSSSSTPTETKSQMAPVHPVAPPTEVKEDPPRREPYDLLETPMNLTKVPPLTNLLSKSLYQAEQLISI